MLRTILIVLSILLIACQPQEQSNNLSELRTQRLNDFEPCQRDSTTQSASLVASSRCLLFMVAENPQQPQNRQIPLQVLLLPALNVESVDDAIVILAGGPGQAASSLVQVAQIFSAMRKDRDIIFMDQRGTGELSPLQCDFDELDEEGGDLEQLLEIQQQMLIQCLAQMDASPEFYTTDLAVDDLEALRVYLGYETFNLWGGSYGTRVALAYLQAYPQSTRTVIIDGVAPPAISLPLYMERDASAALELIFSDCEQQQDCAGAYPDLNHHFDELVEYLQVPQILSFRNAITHDLEEFTMNTDLFLSMVRAPLYGRETQRLLPYIIEQAYEENFQPLIAASSAQDAGINQGMYLSVICNEDLTLFTEEELNDERNNDYLISSELFSTPTLAACKIWPKRNVALSYFDPVESSKPVLIFSGELDPVTPAVWGQQVSKSLTNSRHIVVPGFAHSTFNSTCTINMINDFIETESSAELELDCLQQIRRRPFFISAGGSAIHD